MNLNDLKFETTIKEDSFQRVGTGLISATKETIIWIQIPTYQMSAASKHLVTEHLYNVIDTFDSDNHFYIIMKNVTGKPINDYIKDVQLTYDARIHLCYELLKSLIKYDAFHYTYQLQLITDDQIVVNNDIIMFREIINYALSNQHDFNEVITRIGYLFSSILKSKNDIHVQFTDNLIIGHHQYENLSDLLNDFKDIFIYEKPSAINAMPREYNIIITTDDDHNISTISRTEQVHKPLAENMNTLSKIVPQTSPVMPFPKDNHVLDDFIEREDTPEIKSEAEPLVDSKADDVQEEESATTRELPVKSSESITKEPILDEMTAHETITPAYEADSNEPEEAEEKHDKQAHEDVEQDKQEPLNDSLLEKVNESPEKNNDFMANDPNADLVENEKILEELYGLDEESTASRPIKKYIFPIIAVISLIIIITVGLKVLVFKPDVFEASYKVEQLDNQQIAFINTSESSRKITSCEWDVYYNDEFVQSFITHNFYPVFNTEGDYTIVLKISDDEGNWSEAYTATYAFNPDTNSLEKK